MTKLDNKGVETMTLIELRENAGLTQIELAEKLGTDRTTISKWENGQAWPSMRRVFGYAIALGCSTDSIIYSLLDRSNENGVNKTN